MKGETVGIKEILFTKDSQIVNTVGRETLCCFHAQGLAKKLLAPAIESPISGILHGYKPVRWFSFVWEIVEHVLINGKSCYKISLVLDNLEAKKQLDYNTFEFFIRKIEEAGYYNIYLGYLRNDIDIKENENKYPLIKKPYSLAFYSKCFNSSIDDSAQMYLIHSEKDDEKNLYKDVELKRMNLGDLHRCKYIEAIVYDKRHESSVLREWKKIDVDKNLCYVLSNKNTIFGYFVSSIRYVPKEIKTEKNFNDKIKNTEAMKFKISEDDIIEGKYNKVVYIDDLFCVEGNINLLKKMASIIDEFIKFCEENEIQAIIASTNKYSKGIFEKIKTKTKIKCIELKIEENPVLGKR